MTIVSFRRQILGRYIALVMYAGRIWDGHESRPTFVIRTANHELRLVVR